MNTAKNPLVIILALLVLVAGGAAAYFYQKVRTLEQNPQKIVQEQIKEVVARVSRLIILPEGEDPTVATVSDPEKLKDQPFFAKAKKGDKVLIYTNAKRAILYDPVAEKIIEVAPINIGSAQP